MKEVIYGINPVMEALASRMLDKIYFKGDACSGRLRSVLEKARGSGVTIVKRSKEILDKMARTSEHQGVVALVAPFPLMNLEELVDEAGKRDAFVVVLDGIEDPRNLGAILRTCAAAGVGGVVLPSRRACGLTPAVYKASAGALFHLKMSRVVNVRGAIEKLKEMGFWIHGFASEGDRDYTDVDYKGKIALVFGSEGKGIKPTVRKACDFLAAIPMPGGFESLNLSVAVGIIVYEALRQRRACQN